MADLSKSALFKPARPSAEAKSDTTTRVARSMFEAETAQRKAKTEKLRLARLAKEAAESPPAVAPKKRKGAKAPD